MSLDSGEVGADILETAQEEKTQKELGSRETPEAAWGRRALQLRVNFSPSRISAHSWRGGPSGAIGRSALKATEARGTICL
jgi:hypothetical protein